MTVRARVRCRTASTPTAARSASASSPPEREPGGRADAREAGDDVAEEREGERDPMAADGEPVAERQQHDDGPGDDDQSELTRPRR